MLSMISNNTPFATFSLLIFTIISNSVLADITTSLDDEPISPIPTSVSLNNDKVLLGEKLFHDDRLTANNTMSCASCHQLSQGGDDNQAIGHTPNGEQHNINTPTVFNARYNFRQNWNGSAANLKDQIELLIPSHLEADTNWEDLINKLKNDTAYVKTFKQIYGSNITKEAYLDALTEFEKSLITPNSRFDQYLRGDPQAINDMEKEGYLLFKDYGCISCHQGINVGGNLFQRFGIFYNYLRKRGNITAVDNGRKNITDRHRDEHVFKVPSLRNIEVTAPYFHDGKIKFLKDAILIMGKTQLGITIENKDINKIEMFLNTLTGEYKGKRLGAEKS